MTLRLRSRPLRLATVVIPAFLTVVVPAPSPAQTTFSNAAGITIADGATPPTPANPYPSGIAVSGLTGKVIGKLTVTLTGFAHTYPSDVDVLLVGPTGQSIVLLSDVGGVVPVSGLDLTLDDAAASTLPDSGPLVSGSYQPTNSGTGDTFPSPAPAPSSETSLTAFDGTDPNGTWSLYVVDDTTGDSGSITGGWSLTIWPAQQFVGGAVTIIDGLSPPTKASPYPSTIKVSGVGTTLDALTVTLTNITHRSPDDIDVLLVGPTGANAIIMSDVGGSEWATNVTLTLDDAAASPLPDTGPLVAGSYEPTNIDTAGADVFPAPAPAPAGGAALAVFNGTNPNGTWSLYIVDDSSGDGGSITGWTLTMRTSGAVATTTTTTTSSTSTTTAAATTTTTHAPTTTTGVTSTSTTGSIASSTSTTSPGTTTTSPSTTTSSSPASTTTTTTTTGSTAPSSSTTTIAPRVERDAPIAGTLLKIRDDANVARRSLLVLARDRTIALAHDVSGGADPTLQGARLHVWSETGGAFDASYELPATGWRVLGSPAVRKGYRYDDRRGAAGPVRSVLVKDGVMVKVAARGMPDVSLATVPDPVGVTLTAGDVVYCLSFGGTVKFTSGRSYVAKNAPIVPCP